MRKIVLLFAFGLLAAVPQACRQESSSATGAGRTKNIATDLPDDGGALVNSLFWTNNGHIYRGRCINADEFDRSTCSSELVSMSYDTFKGELDGGLSETIRGLSAQAHKIQDAIASIERDLADARRELDALESQQGGLDSELAALRNNIKNYEITLSGYREQLALIDAALREAADQEIEAMRPLVLARIADWQSRIQQVSAQIERVLEQFGELRTQIAQVAARVNALTVRSQNLQIELADVSQRLELAYGDFSVYEETIRRLSSGITYTVWSTNTILLRQRLFIRRFETIFAKHT